LIEGSGYFYYVTSSYDFSSHRRVVGSRPRSGERAAAGRPPSRVSSQLFDQNAQMSRDTDEKPRRRAAMYMWIVAAVVIAIIGLIQLFATYRLYSASKNQVTELQQQKAHITHQRDELDRQIARWNDKNYVGAQARSRLGFVFPGETSIRVTGAEKYMDRRTARAGRTKKSDEWYERMKKSWINADRGTSKSRRTQSAHTAPSGRKVSHK
jgi:cell division protein FtsB